MILEDGDKFLNIRSWLRLHKPTLYTIEYLCIMLTTPYIEPVSALITPAHPGYRALFVRASEELLRSRVTSRHDRTTHTSMVWPCSLKIIHDECTI